MKLFAAAAAAFVLSAGAAGAADLIVEESVAAPDAALASGVYAQFLIGGVLPGPQNWVNGGFSGVWDMHLGPAIAGTIGVTVVDGLSVELDALYTSREFDPADSADGGSETISVMGNLKYTFAINDAFDLYLAGGVGYIKETHLGDIDFDGFGYQVIAGAGYHLTDDITLVGEYRFQDSFGALVNEDDSDWTHEVPKHVLLAGLKFGF